MAHEYLDENVQDVEETDFLHLELLPTGHLDWGLVTNNNFIKVEKAIEINYDQIEEIKISLNGWNSDLPPQVQENTDKIDEEVLNRTIAINNLQAQIKRARFDSELMSKGVSRSFIHNLKEFPMVSVIREDGAGGGTDVTNAFDTLIIHSNVDQIDITVGINGNYTIVCVA